MGRLKGWWTFFCFISYPHLFCYGLQARDKEAFRAKATVLHHGKPVNFTVSGVVLDPGVLNQSTVHQADPAVPVEPAVHSYPCSPLDPYRFNFHGLSLSGKNLDVINYYQFYPLDASSLKG